MNNNPKNTIDRAGTPALQQVARQWRGFDVVSTVEETNGSIRVRYKNSYHAIYVLLAGRFNSFEITVDSGRPRILSPVEGDIFVIPANCEVIKDARGGRVECAELCFPLDAIANVFGGGQKPPDIAVTLGVRDEFIYRSARKLASILVVKDPLSELFGANLLSSLCLYLCMNYSQADGMEREADRSPLSALTRERLRQYLEANLDRRITLPKMAEIAKMPPRQFLQHFQQHYGMTPIQHLIRIRIARACELLLTNSVNILDIAMLTGFSSHAHLTRTFKERIGFSPSEYRRRFRG